MLLQYEMYLINASFIHFNHGCKKISLALYLISSKCNCSMSITFLFSLSEGQGYIRKFECITKQFPLIQHKRELLELLALLVFYHPQCFVCAYLTGCPSLLIARQYAT